MSGMKIINVEHVDVPIEAVAPHPENPRQGDVGAIATSIDNNGFYGEIVVQKSTNLILAGNHRYLAAKALGATVIPITYVDVNDELALRILIADNRGSDLATYDDNKLVELLQGLAATDDGLMGTLYDGDDLDAMIAKLNGNGAPIGDAEVNDLPTSWSVVIECGTEEEQIRLLDELGGRGLNVRALIT